MRLHTQRGKADTFEATVSPRGPGRNPGPNGVMLALLPDDDPWRAAYVWVSPSMARRVAGLILRAADRAENRDSAT